MKDRTMQALYLLALTPVAEVTGEASDGKESIKLYRENPSIIQELQNGSFKED